VHPGHTVDEVTAETGWNLRAADGVGDTAGPTEEELAAIRKFDPEGFWTRS
jgi:glutaconate CoA-transferase, subunit B